MDIEILKVGKDSKVEKFAAAGHYTVPGYSEQVTDGRFLEDDHTIIRDVVVEPFDGFTDRYPLVMASIVVNMNSTPTQKVRLLNPSVPMNQDSVIDRTVRYEDLSVLVESEDPNQSGYNNAVRRIQLTSQYEKADVIRVVAHTLQSKVPSHVEQLCSQACENKSTAERDFITDLLVRHTDGSLDMTMTWVKHLLQST